MSNCEVLKSMRKMCNENCEDWEACPLARILREGKSIAGWERKTERMRPRDMWPAVCALIGVCIINFNLALGLSLCFISAIYMFRAIFRTSKKETEDLNRYLTKR